MKKPKNGDPGRWAHQVVVTISDGELSTKEMPLVYRRGERYQSASDGGFYRFEGCLVSENDHYRAERRLMRAEYAEAGAVLNKAVSIKPRGASIEVNGTHYRRVANPETW